MTFGEVIVKARKSKGLSQKQLASLIKKKDGGAISAPYLNDIEHDRRSPSSDHLIEQFADLLEIKPEVLYFVAKRIPSYAYETPTDEKLMVAALQAFKRVLQRGDATDAAIRVS